jgi:hypothetical protein
LTVVDAIVIVFLFPVVATASHVGTGTTYSAEVGVPEDGLWVDGEQVTNIFAYDADGEYIERAQLLDDRGQPVTLGLVQGQMNRDWTGYVFSQPAQDAYGRALWNVFPLQTWQTDDPDMYLGDPVPPEGAMAVAPPVAQLAPLADLPAGSGPTEPAPVAPASDVTPQPEEPTD